MISENQTALTPHKLSTSLEKEKTFKTLPQISVTANAV
jgi:hypothetical protein